jgi:hypothetical protein
LYLAIYLINNSIDLISNHDINISFKMLTLINKSTKTNGIILAL